MVKGIPPDRECSNNHIPWPDRDLQEVQSWNSLQLYIDSYSCKEQKKNADRKEDRHTCRQNYNRITKSWVSSNEDGLLVFDSENTAKPPSLISLYHWHAWSPNPGPPGEDLSLGDDRCWVWHLCKSLDFSCSSSVGTSGSAAGKRMVIRPPKKIRLGFSQAGAGCTSKHVAPVKKQISVSPGVEILEKCVASLEYGSKQ